MLAKLNSILLSALSNWLRRPIQSIAGLWMIYCGLPLMLVSKLFSIESKLSINTPYLTGYIQIDNLDEPLLFVSGLVLVVLGVVLISWGTFALRPAQAEAKERLALLLQGSPSPGTNGFIQHEFETAYGYSTDLKVIRAVMHSSDPDQFALDARSARSLVKVVGTVFLRRKKYDVKAALTTSVNLYFIVAFSVSACPRHL